MKRISLVIALPLALIVALICVWAGCEIYHARSSSAEGIGTYEAYRSSLPPPRAVRSITKDGQVFYVFFGPIRAPLALPSGPPAYIFDQNGKLIDWALDSGENPRFSSMWRDHQGREIEIIEFEQILAQNKKAHSVDP